MEEIPNIPFYKRSNAHLGFEIISLQGLFHRQAQLAHRLDRPHRLEFFSILFITRGSGRHFIDFEWHPYQQGALIFSARGQVHAFEIRPENDGFQILFTEDFLQRLSIQSGSFALYRMYDHTTRSPVIQPDEAGYEDVADLIRDIRQEFANSEPFAKEELLACYLKLLLLKAERMRAAAAAPVIASPARYQTFLSFKRALETHYSTTRNAEGYAAMLYISYKHLNTICREFTSLSAKQFIDQWLVLEIKRQLASSGLSIKEIAHQAGFSEPTNLVKFFKQRTGQTPASFRQAHL
jgi:AraC-like DNA-binding protein